MPVVQQKLFGVRWTPEGEITSDVASGRGEPVYQEINDAVDVLALFEKGGIKPQRFRWKGHVHRVAQITGSWKTEQGAYKRRHFSLMDEDANFFQLLFDERTSTWKITRVWVE